jgi:hypothetical protein
MFRVMITAKRRPGMTLEDYAMHYKTKHLPLILSSLPRKFKSIQVRIVNRDDPFLPLCGDGADSNPSFDSITELQFESRADAEEVFKKYQDPLTQELLNEDEARFAHLPTIRFYIVEMLDVVTNMPVSETT